MKKQNFYVDPKNNKELKYKISIGKGDSIIKGQAINKYTNAIYVIEDGIPDFTFPKSLAKLDKETRDKYEKLANEYDKFADIPFKTFCTDEFMIRQKLTDLLNIKSDSKILEVGAGDGRGSYHIARRMDKRGFFYIQELSKAFLKKAICRLKEFEKKTNIEYSVANAMYLPFKDNTFDSAHHFGGMNTFSDQKKFLREMLRVVKPGGKIVVGDEGMAPWLRKTKMGKIMMNSNPLLKCEIPLNSIPVEARNVKVEWIMMGAFFIIEFEVGNDEPIANYHIQIPSDRGGTHWTRYYGNLEGVTDNTKKIAYELQTKSGKTMHHWLEYLIKKEAGLI